MVLIVLQATKVVLDNLKRTHLVEHDTRSLTNVMH